MKKLLLTVAGAVAISGMTTAQNRMITNSVENANTGIKTSNLLAAKTSSTCSDTLMNFAPTATLTVYTAGTSGYVAGTNNYNDVEKAEWFAASTYTNISNPSVAGVIVGFYRNTAGTRGTMGNPSTPLNLVIYDGNSTSGPSTAAGTYTATIGSVVAAASGTSNIIWYLYSGSTVPVTNPSVGFFASVQIPDGTVAGDTAVIFAASVTTNTAWEKWSDNNWYAFSSTSSWGANLSLAIIPIVTGSCVTTSVGNNYDLNQVINILPNPSTTGKVFVTGSFPTEQSISVEVVNVLGQIVETKESKFKTGMIMLDMENLNNGIYFINVSNGNQKITRRVVLNK